MAAAADVLGTVELLESILLHLNFNDLSRCFRVCRRFKATIDGSKSLQLSLWLLADEQSYSEIFDNIIKRDPKRGYSSWRASPETNEALLQFMRTHFHPVLSSLLSGQVITYRDVPYGDRGDYDWDDDGSEIEQDERTEIYLFLDTTKLAFYRRRRPLPTNWASIQALKRMLDTRDFVSILLHCSVDCRKPQLFDTVVAKDRTLRDAIALLQDLPEQHEQDHHKYCKGERRQEFYFALGYTLKARSET